MVPVGRMPLKSLLIDRIEHVVSGEQPSLFPYRTHEGPFPCSRGRSGIPVPDGKDGTRRQEQDKQDHTGFIQRGDRRRFGYR